MLNLVMVIVIAAGPMVERIEELSHIVDYSILYEWDGIENEWTSGVSCDCTPQEAFERLVGARAHVDAPYRNTFTMTTREIYCEPELGAKAPLPPCLPRPQEIIVRAKRPVI